MRRTVVLAPLTLPYSASGIRFALYRGRRAASRPMGPWLWRAFTHDAYCIQERTALAHAS
jgi:hypothetical protein